MKSIKGKTLSVSLLAVLALFLINSSLFAYDKIVTGKGNAEVDVKAVQEAVDQGGKLLLKGSFVFGPEGSVKIKEDIEIHGEVNNAGVPVTKINGGFQTFQTILPSTDPPLPGPGPKIKIKNRIFDSSLERLGNLIRLDSIGIGHAPRGAAF